MPRTTLAARATTRGCYNSNCVPPNDRGSDQASDAVQKSNKKSRRQKKNDEPSLRFATRAWSQVTASRDSTVMEAKADGQASGSSRKRTRGAGTVVDTLSSVKKDFRLWAKCVEDAVHKHSKAEICGDQEPPSTMTIIQSAELSKFVRSSLVDEVERMQRDGAAEAADALVHQDIMNVLVEEGLELGEPIWLPDSSLERTAPLKNWADFAKVFPDCLSGTRRPGSNSAAFAEAPWCVLAEALSFPLTIARCIDILQGEKCQQQNEPRRVVHVDVLGPEKAEMDNLAKWTILLNLFPSLLRVEIRFVGPQVPKDLDNKAARLVVEGSAQAQADKKKADSRQESDARCERDVLVSFHRALYHDFLKSGPAREGVADIVIAFNAGLADAIESWGPSIKAICELGCLCAFTSYHSIEAHFDSRVAGALGAQQWDAPGQPPRTERNGFRSLIPITDSIFPPRVYYTNEFIMLFRGGQSVGSAAAGPKNKVARAAATQ